MPGAKKKADKPGGLHRLLSNPLCSRTLRASLFGLVKYFISRDVGPREAHPIVAFLLSEKDDVLVRELLEILTHYLEGKQSKDQGRIKGFQVLKVL